MASSPLQVWHLHKDYLNQHSLHQSNERASFIWKTYMKPQHRFGWANFCLWSLDPGNIESDQMRTGWAMSIIKRRLRGWKTKSERQSDEMVRRRCFRTTSVKMEQTGQNTRSSCRFLFHRSGENMSVLNIFMQSNHLNGFFSDLSQTTGSKWPSVSRVSHCFNTVNWESRLDHRHKKQTHPQHCQLSTGNWPWQQQRWGNKLRAES